jgi:hypothetical protein
VSTLRSPTSGATHSLSSQLPPPQPNPGRWFAVWLPLPWGLDPELCR